MITFPPQQANTQRTLRSMFSREIEGVDPKQLILPS